MQNSFDDLGLSRTFKVSDGVLSVVDLRGTGSHSSVGSIARTAEHRVGDLIDRKYKVLAPLGEGGMGIVFLVMHISLNREVALKTFLRGEMAPEAWERFQREARALAKLTHPNIIQVFDSGVSELNFPFYTMELLKGESLAERIERIGAIDVAETLPIFIAVAEGLAHAHKLGIVHRDIKPANIFMHKVGGHETPKIVDFGLAKLAQSQSEAALASTSAGMVFGSPLFMSPEQSLGLETDQRTDIYSFGCSLFQALTGEPPLRGTNFLATIMLHQQEVPPWMVEVAPEVYFPQRLEAIVAKLLDKDLQSRYQSFEEVLADLSKVETVDSLLSQQGRQSSSTTSQNAVSFVRRPAPTFRPVIEESIDESEDSEPKIGRKKIVVAVTFATVSVLSLFLVFFFRFYPWPNKTMPDAPAAQAVQASATNLIDTTKTFPLAGTRRSDGETDLKVRSGATASANISPEKAHSFFSKRNKQGDIIFDFPSVGEPIGALSWAGHSSVPAKGHIVVPAMASDSVRFDAGHGMLIDPAMWSGFRPDDLDFVELTHNGGMRWSHEHIVQVCKLKSLHCLILNSENLDKEDFLALDKLTRLTWLDISKGEFSADDICNLKRLRSLVRLELNDTEGASDVLDLLRGSESIKILALNACGLKDTDLKTIGTMPNLSVLLIDNNPDVSLRGLSHLTSCHRLEWLQMENDSLGPAATAYLAKFPALIHLVIGSPGGVSNQFSWNTSAIGRLHKILPKCKIIAG